MSRYERASFYQHIGERVVRLESKAGEADFSPVVQVDGQCLIVPKSVWREHPFDEELFRDFHLYDVDFCAPADIQFGPPAPIRIDRAYDKRLSSDECSSDARRTTGTTTGVMTPDYFHDPAK